MNTIDSIIAPPVPRAQSDPKEHTIGLHIGITVNALTTEFFPRKNFVASSILRRLLSDALSAAGIETRPAVGSLEFNDSTYFFYVRDRLHAVRVIKEKLATTGLLEFAQIAALDLDEDYWRDFYSTTGRPFTDYLDLARVTAEADRLQSLFEEWRLRLEKLKPQATPKPPNSEGPHGD